MDFKTPIPLALSSIPDDLRLRRNDVRLSTSIFIINGHFMAGFTSPSWLACKYKLLLHAILHHIDENESVNNKAMRY